jgi:hypothetical protein
MPVIILGGIYGGVFTPTRGRRRRGGVRGCSSASSSTGHSDGAALRNSRCVSPSRRRAVVMFIVATAEPLRVGHYVRRDRERRKRLSSGNPQADAASSSFSS